ncbi:unnamed protein product [Pylaiella littoralis]
MKFDLRSTVHLGADVLLDGQVDPASSTGDFILSGGDLSQPLRLQMRSGNAYIATDSVLHAPFLHGIRHPGQSSISVVSTWSPGGGVFNLFRSKSHPLAASFSFLCGVKAVDGQQAFEVTTVDLVPPKKVKARIQQPGDFADGVSLFRAHPQEQASAYHRLGKMISPNGGAVQSGKQTKPNDKPRGPGAAGKKVFDYTPYRRSIGHHHRGYKSERGALVKSENTSEFFEYRISKVNKGAWTLSTRSFNTHNNNTPCYPCGVDGTRIETKANVKRDNRYLMKLAREAQG